MVMIRSVLIVTMLVAILLVGFWTRNLRQQNEALQSKVRGLEKKLLDDKTNYDKLYYNFVHEESLVRHGSDNAEKTAQGFRDQIVEEEQKVAALKQALQELKGQGKGPDGMAQAHIDEDNAAVAKVEAQMARLNDDSKTVNERSRSYREEQSLRQNQRKAELQADLQSTNANLQNLQGQMQVTRQEKRDPGRAGKIQTLQNELNELRGHRQQTEQQLKELVLTMKNTDQAINQEVRSEQSEVKADREQAERQLKDLKADLEKWKKQASAQRDGNQATGEKIKGIMQEIAQHTERILNLQNLLRTLPK